MISNLAAKYNAPVPRYTSYPTAPHFKAFDDSSLYASWLSDLDPAKPISIYLHVPFCKKMCWYCGCHTKVTKQYDPVGDYAETLRAEIRNVAAVLPERFRVSHVHWGGGTPSILSADDFKSVMAVIAENFDYTADAERAIEIDPRVVDATKVKALAEAGINRASLGVQDFNPKIQKAINRVQSYEMTADVVNLLRENGINKLNFDLMYGLPLQTTEDVARTIDLSHQLKPDRIALFGYAHVPWMKTHMKMIKDEELPGTEERILQATCAADHLTELGYQQIGLDHFASPDDEMSVALDNQQLRRNFQGYTTDAADTMIGIGASSIGKLPQGYVQNYVSTGEYKKRILNDNLAAAKGIAVSTDDKIRCEVIERLMCDLSVDLDEVTEQFGQPVATFDNEIELLKDFQKDGLLTLKGRRVTVTLEGRFLVRSICAVFDTYLGSGAGRHSKAV
ncbi:MAG: oxygen-independent coproporphyrinogen III oxidase [Pseudomonas marincola]